MWTVLLSLVVALGVLWLLAVVIVTELFMWQEKQHRKAHDR